MCIWLCVECEECITVSCKSCCLYFHLVHDDKSLAKVIPTIKSRIFGHLPELIVGQGCDSLIRSYSQWLRPSKIVDRLDDKSEDKLVLPTLACLISLGTGTV